MPLNTYVSRGLKTAAIGALAGVCIWFDPFGFDFTYKGSIAGKRVKYTEDGGLFGFGSNNKLRVYHGKETYIFTDSDDQKGIEWQVKTNTAYLSNEIEKMSIVRYGLRKNDVFRSDDIDGKNTLNGQKAEELIERGTAYFNAIQAQIREVKQTEFLARFKNVDAFLSGYAPTNLVHSTITNAVRSASTNMAPLAR